MNVNPVRTAPAPVAPREAARPAPAPDAGAHAAPAAKAARAESLWDVLTPEEREFFARQEALGPLTYGRPRRAQDQPAAPVGGRLDVRG